MIVEICLWFPLKKESLEGNLLHSFGFLVFLLPVMVSISSHRSLSNHPWFIDFGTSHHMTGMFSIFSSYRVCFGRDKEHIAYFSLSFVTGSGCILLTTFPLSSLFHVSNFKLKLVLVSHISKT